MYSVSLLYFMTYRIFWHPNWFVKYSTGLALLSRPYKMPLSLIGTLFVRVLPLPGTLPCLQESSSRHLTDKADRAFCALVAWFTFRGCGLETDLVCSISSSLARMTHGRRLLVGQVNCRPPDTHCLCVHPLPPFHQSERKESTKVKTNQNSLKIHIAGSA